MRHLMRTSVIVGAVALAASCSQAPTITSGPSATTPATTAGTTTTTAKRLTGAQKKAVLEAGVLTEDDLPRGNWKASPGTSSGEGNLTDELRDLDGCEAVAELGATIDALRPDDKGESDKFKQETSSTYVEVSSEVDIMPTTEEAEEMLAALDERGAECLGDAFVVAQQKTAAEKPQEITIVDTSSKPVRGLGDEAAQVTVVAQATPANATKPVDFTLGLLVVRTGEVVISLETGFVGKSTLDEKGIAETLLGRVQDALA